MYPEKDNQFEEVKVAKATRVKGGYTIERSDRWSFWVPGDSPIEPKEGMTARFYSKGIGSTVRGLFLDGIKVFYRTESEEHEYREIQMYGADAADWLKRWDEEKSVWSIEMGGLGPGYEQCIHITCAEILRDMLAKQYDHSKWDAEDCWGKDLEQMTTAGFANPTITALGLSGAQWGAAMQLARALYVKGPRALMNDKRISNDRHIQVSKNFPGCVGQILTG